MEMIENIGSELMNILRCIAAGSAAGVLYDSVKSWRIRFRPGKKAVFASDVAYCVLTALLFFVYLLSCADGELRLSLFLSFAAGFMLYRILLSALILRVFGIVLWALSAAFSFLYRILLVPAAKIAKKMCVFFAKPLQFLNKCIKIILLKYKKKRIRRKIAGRKRRCIQKQNRIQKEKAGCSE